MPTTFVFKSHNYNALATIDPYEPIRGRTFGFSVVQKKITIVSIGGIDINGSEGVGKTNEFGKVEVVIKVTKLPQPPPGDEFQNEQ